MADAEHASKSPVGVCSGRILLFAEVKQLLSAVQLVLDTQKFNTGGFRNVNITFTNSQISVQVDDKTVTFHFDQLRLSPVSCNGLICLPNGEIQLRMQVSGPNIGCQANTSQKSHHQRQLVERLQKKYHLCACVMCGQRLLTKDCKFKRVLPLPSENWNDLADSWFCHRHDDQSGAIPNTLLPRESDCLVGELYCLIHKSKLAVKSYQISANHYLQCCRCRNPIGELYKGRPLCKEKAACLEEKVVYPDTVKLHYHSISLSSEERNTHRKAVELSGNERIHLKQEDSNLSDRIHLKEEDFLARYFLDQCRIFTSYRFLVQPQVANQKHCKQCCLVWLLDGDALMYSQEVALRSEVTEVKQTTVVKVLYRAYFQTAHSCPGQKNCADPYKTWRKDRTVHDIELPHSLYIAFLTSLVRNTRHLPSSLRYLNGFHVGYLHKLPASVT
ncbi:E3 ubiquitin-protein ligase E3D-like [Liolophura sinensis]|uniref:E3 ubiquitin-protein ligase E3D-like n=1 Tax=Liolophura sinensis TaxID=3198878 RepID=UPI0031596FE9